MIEPFVQTFQVGDSLTEVTRIQDLLGAIWDEHGLPPENESDASLMVEEVLTNILRHGRHDGQACNIEMTLSCDAQGFEIHVSDTAAPYDPLARPDPDVTLSLENRRPGGLGVFMVKRLADQIAYQYVNGRNHLRIGKRFSGCKAD
jgi:anti-sigma regulatory factor (Ser/Thr protein kinase)